MFAALPELCQLRQFVLRVYRIFDPQASFRQAAGHWANLVNDADLARALAMLGEEKFEKMRAYLHNPVGQRVRTDQGYEFACGERVVVVFYRSFEMLSLREPMFFGHYIEPFRKTQGISSFSKNLRCAERRLRLVKDEPGRWKFPDMRRSAAT